MTSRSTGLIALIAGFVIAGEMTDLTVLSQLAMGLLVLLIVCWSWAQTALSGLNVSRNVNPDKLQVGDVIADTFEVRSVSQIPKLWVEVRDLAHLPGHDGSNVFSVRRRGSVSWSAQSIAVRRGVFPIGPLELRSGDPLGIFERTRRVKIGGDLTIYPPVFDLPALRLPFADATGRREIERRALMATPSVATVRDYVAGDPLNKISWALTARMGKLMVKEFDLDPTAEIWVVADFSSAANLPASRSVLLNRADRFGFAEAWLDSSEDLIASLAASAVKLALDHKRSVGFIGSAGGRTVLSADIGDRQYHKILTELAVAQPSGAESTVDVIVGEVRRFDRNRTPIVISASADPQWIETLASMTERGIRPIAIFVDPATLDPSRDSSLIRQRIRKMTFPVFVVDFAAGIDAGFQPAEANPVMVRPTQSQFATLS